MEIDIQNKPRNAPRTMQILRSLKVAYSRKGIHIVGIFGSWARRENDAFSDIDIAYIIDYEKLSANCPDGFSKILELQDMKRTLETQLQRQVDLVSLNSRNKGFLNRIQQEMIHV